MNVLFVASECAPFVKTGGLADVIGAVPKALGSIGAQVKVMLPAYPALAMHVASGTEVGGFGDLFGGPARLVAAEADGLDLLLLDAPHLFDRPGNIYLDQNGKDWFDNHLRFGGLCFAAAQVAQHGAAGWRPDLVNAHDWQAGLVPAYLRQTGVTPPPVVMTIHNIAFQGLFPQDVLEVLRLDRRLFTPDALEFYGQLGFLKSGLALCDAITTVSPTYARELLTPDFGMGLEGLLQERQKDLTGILNGIDVEIWNPETDPHLAKPYGLRSLKSKAANKTALRKRFGLEAAVAGPLFCVISRLTTQKGLDLLVDCLPDLVAEDAQLALLGSGEGWMEQAFAEAATRFPGRVGTIIGYDEPLSHLMQGGSDAILIPSRFEPCGLTQLYGLRYGTLPVVARTGGLADTVIDANEAALTANCATGLQFAPATAERLRQAIVRTCALYRDQKTWAGMMRRAMRHPVGWDGSAAAYAAVYDRLLPAR
ncbi:glycogen synthase GlgA [Sulfitobacter sp. D35]|uniref:glycogen synthase GlgA n=1 Tax=Sulfitobacter sp. D35 TaxID=3083252 RepID=UPI00296F7D97|nr:glycogen synthase GlgA [Sulfitobacter sp. D35]MDW4498949.1 glycogen synthase GlgA [Sulfitobacter sp. D35]